MSQDLVQCYNRGCGQKFQANRNSEEVCRHHPGEPFFHDAYKGWSCCNKKCTDFTEFLNIEGCTLSKHSNIKPPEPEKPPRDLPDVEIVEVKPIQKSMVRPPFNTPTTTMRPEIAPSVLTNLATLKMQDSKGDSDEINAGTSCKNGGCTTTYEDHNSNVEICTYHPGVPIFHEGLKFWSCCQRRTTDFNAFLSQIGCEKGKHVWRKAGDNSKVVKCRWDFHQTGTHVFVSIYAKAYCPESSIVKLSPVRLYANLVFPQQDGAAFNMDVELNGIIDVEKSQVSMLGTKVEIKMKKAEPCSWRRLEYTTPSDEIKRTADVKDLISNVEGVDLEDL